MQRSDSDRQFCGCPCFVTQSYETLEARRCQHSPNPPVSERFSVWRHRANTLHRDARKGLDEPTNGLIGPDHAGKRYSVPCSHRPARPCSRADISLGLKRLACPLSFDSRTTFNEHLGTRCKNELRWSRTWSMDCDTRMGTILATANLASNDLPVGITKLSRNVANEAIGGGVE